MYQHKWNITHVDKLDVYIQPSETSILYRLVANSDYLVFDENTSLRYDHTYSQKVGGKYFVVQDRDFPDAPLAFILLDMLPNG